MPTRIRRSIGYNPVSERRWHKFYDCCVKCGRSDVAHARGGLCAECYRLMIQEHLPPVEESVAMYGRRTISSLPRETYAKLRQLKAIFGGIEQSRVVRLAIDLLYDAVAPSIGKLELTPEGFLDIMANMRLEIVRAGLRVKAEDIRNVLTQLDAYVDEPAEDTPENAVAVGGQMYGMKRT